MSRSWGFTDGTTYSLKNAVMPFFDLSNYAKIKDEDDEKVYVNLTCPTNQQEHVTVRSGRLNNVSTSFKKAYPSESKGGYQFSVKREMVNRDTKADGTIYDDYAKCIITCAATDGTNVQDVLPDGAAWLPIIMRTVSTFAAVTYDVSDGAVTVKLTQAELDRLMHGASELASVNTQQD